MPDLRSSAIEIARPKPIAPPVAQRIRHREVRHGETVIDDYYWLREKSDPAVLGYLQEENAYTEACTQHLKELEDKLYREMLSHLKETDLTVPVPYGPFLYYSRTEEGKQYPIQCRRKGEDGAEEILLDLNELAKGHTFVGLGAFEVSDDHNLLAYSIDHTGFRQYTLHVKDLRTAAVLHDTAERVTSVEWAADSHTLFFTTEDAVTKRPDKLWRHALGSPDFECLYEEADELYDIDLQRTRDKRYLVLEIHSKDTTECRYVAAHEPEQQFSVFLPRRKEHRYYIEHREGLFYIRTNRNGKNFEVCTVPDTDPRVDNWSTFIEHRRETLIEDIDLFRDFLVCIEKTNALTNIRVYDFQTRAWSAIPVPEPIYSVSPGGTREYESRTYRYNYQSFIIPPSIFDYDVTTGDSKLLKRQEVPGGYEPSRYASERIWATARDGTNVPISIVYRREFQRDGQAPLLLYGYGSYGYAIPVTFDSTRLSLIDRGFAYAIAHIRGGDDLGEDWREQGMLMKKWNTFHDFIDCAECLIRKRWTSKDRLIIEGRSAGGLLMGAVINARPDLFRAAHLGVPFVDVINTMMDASLPLTVGEYLEWGDPNERPAYEYMRSYSPYDNLVQRQYPAMLVTTSLNDSQVMYWEPAKYVARLRALNPGMSALLLKAKLEPAGHGGASGRYDKLKDRAFEYAWMLDQVGISE